MFPMLARVLGFRSTAGRSRPAAHRHVHLTVEPLERRELMNSGGLTDTIIQRPADATAGAFLRTEMVQLQLVSLSPTPSTGGTATTPSGSAAIDWSHVLINDLRRFGLPKPAVTVSGPAPLDWTHLLINDLRRFGDQGKTVTSSPADQWLINDLRRFGPAGNTTTSGPSGTYWYDPAGDLIDKHGGAVGDPSTQSHGGTTVTITRCADGTTIKVTVIHKGHRTITITASSDPKDATTIVDETKTTTRNTQRSVTITTSTSRTYDAHGKEDTKKRSAHWEQVTRDKDGNIIQQVSADYDDKGAKTHQKVQDGSHTKEWTRDDNGWHQTQDGTPVNSQQAPPHASDPGEPFNGMPPARWAY